MIIINAKHQYWIKSNFEFKRIGIVELKIKFRWQVERRSITEQDEPRWSWIGQGPAEVIRFGFDRGIRNDASAQEPLPRFFSFCKCKDEQKRLVDPTTGIPATDPLLFSSVYQFRFFSSASSAFRRRETSNYFRSTKTSANTDKASAGGWWLRIRWSAGRRWATSQLGGSLCRNEKPLASVRGLLSNIFEAAASARCGASQQRIQSGHEGRNSE